MKIYNEKDLESDTTVVSIEGGVYDLVAFAPKHPGGNLIQACGGLDCTALFYSMHPHNPQKNLRVLEKYRVGKMENGPKFNFSFDSPFANELRDRVAEKVAQVTSHWYAPIGFWMRTIVIISLTLYFEYQWIITGSIAAMVAVGVLHAWIGLAVQHDASHGAFSSNPYINSFFAYGADWVGNTKWLWMQQHIIGHHPHTNIENHDPDAHSAQPMLNFHIFPVATRPFLLQFQWLYMYLVLPFYGPSVVYNIPELLSLNHGEIPSDNAYLNRRKPFSYLMRLFYYARIVCAPIYLADVHWALAMVGVPFVAGFCLTFVFVLSHNFLDSERFPLQNVSKGKPADWYKLQAETSCSYGGNIAMFFTGGLNFQIEHHLFPRLCSWYYPFIAPTVADVCKKYNVQYIYYPSIFANIYSTLKYMFLNGRRSGDARIESLKQE
uniref:Delta5-desaturase n=1 Tax=Oblongichytrium sp. SEK 347 TaxID=420540 RepID=B5MFC9_9STRA|nr:delta5-desaturase [Oblongichytrium sp. SEK 347]